MHLLLVDDNADMRTSFGIVLRHVDSAIRLSTAKDGRQAYDLLREGLRPDVILLDLMMPTWNGWQLLAEIDRDKSIPRIPVVLFSAFADLPVDAPKDRVACIVSKSTKPESLLERLRKVVEASKKEQP